MSVNISILLVIIGCAIVTIVPRITPFIIIKKLKLPKVVIKWLSFIPICIFTALIVNSFIVQQESGFTIDWLVLAAILPTLIVAIWTKSLSLTVIVGIVTMAAIRYLF